MLNSRCSNMLDLIISNDKPIIVNDIADKLNISSRTVRYDLDRIGDYLKEINLPNLERKPNLGVSLKLNEIQKEKLFKLLGKINNYDYVLSKRERVIYAIRELLVKSDFTTINSLSDRMMVSRSTVINDLSDIKKWIFENNLQFESLKGHGIKVFGNEVELRKATAKLIIQGIGTLNLLNVNMMKLFKDVDMDFIRNSIKLAEEQMEGTFSDDAFNNLVIHIAIAIKRIQLSKDIIMNKEELKDLRKTEEFVISSGIAKMLEERFLISVPEDEIGYMAIHLLGSNIISIENADKDDWVHVHLIASTLIEEVENRLGYDFSSDSRLFDGLLQHIRPAIYRFKNDLKVKNPLIDEIKMNYYSMFMSIKQSVKFIEDELGKIIDEEEIGYLTLHFMASLERLKNDKFMNPNVLVVCATGLGTSKFVALKLKSIFDINIIDTIPSHDVEKVLKNNRVDVIVTTIPLKVKGIRCILVNTFLTEKNISDLSIFIAKIIKKNESEGNRIEVSESLIQDPGENTFSRLLNIISDNCTINDYDGLKSKLVAYLNIKEGIMNETYKPSLKELINTNFIKVNVQADDWEDAVRKSGQILKDNGCIKERYIEAMVNTVKKVGPYIVILPGIAMPHASPKDGVIKIGYSIITLKTPVIFGNSENDPVSLLVAFAATDNLKHMNALKDIMKTIEQDDFISKACSAKIPEQILNIFLNGVVSGT